MQDQRYSEHFTHYSCLCFTGLLAWPTTNNGDIHYTVTLTKAIETVIEEYGLIYLGLQKAHPVSVALCPKWIDIISYYWKNVMEQGDLVANQFNQGKKPSVQENCPRINFLFHAYQQIRRAKHINNSCFKGCNSWRERSKLRPTMAIHPVSREGGDAETE